MPLLNDKEKTAVREAIAQVELHTSGELVTVIAPASDDYFYIPTLWAAMIALLIPGGFLVIGTWHNAMTLFSIQMAAFIALTVIFRIPKLKYTLVPKHIKHLRASRVAREQFFAQGLQNTKDRTGVLLFVSVAEHYVEVIADKGINDVVPSGSWEKVIADFIENVKAKKYAAGFVTAIEDCGDLLKMHFPADKENTNELPDHLIELD